MSVKKTGKKMRTIQLLGAILIAAFAALTASCMPTGTDNPETQVPQPRNNNSMPAPDIATVTPLHTGL